MKGIVTWHEECGWVIERDKCGKEIPDKIYRKWKHLHRELDNLDEILREYEYTPIAVVGPTFTGSYG